MFIFCYADSNTFIAYCLTRAPSPGSSWSLPINITDPSVRIFITLPLLALILSGPSSLSFYSWECLARLRCRLDRLFSLLSLLASSLPSLASPPSFSSLHAPSPPWVHASLIDSSNLALSPLLPCRFPLEVTFSSVLTLAMKCLVSRKLDSLSALTMEVTLFHLSMFRVVPRCPSPWKRSSRVLQIPIYSSFTRH